MLIACVVGLLLAGLSGIARGDELVGKGNYFSRQVVWVVLSLPAMVFAASVPYRILRGWSYPLFAVSLLLLLLVYAMPPINGARRWIPLGILNFQPSEVCKLTYIMALSHYLMHRDSYRTMFGLIVPFSLTLVPVALILREPDLGTSLLFLPVLFAMLFAAGARLKHMLIIIVFGVATLPLLWAGMSAEQRSRVTALFMQEDGGPAPRDDGYHLHQSKQVLALGGVWGSEFDGVMSDDLSAYHLPAARTDFVFCLIGERWGMIGCLLTLMMFLGLFGSGLTVAARTREPFGRLLAAGVVSLLAAQAAINASMTVGLMPITGMTLPLMSYGGSSLLSTCFALGLLINVALRPGYEVAPEPFHHYDR